MLTRYLDPKNDLCFKRIFGTEKNKDILIHFLNDILERPSPVIEVTYLKTIQDPEIAKHRVTIVDVMCQDQSGDRFVIEMQLSHEKGFDRRALYYASKAYCSQRTTNIEYHDLKDVYFLAVTDFTPFPKKKHWFSRIGLKDLDTNEHDIKAIQLFFLQLPLFTKTKEDLKTMSIKEKWAYFFKHAEHTNDKELDELIGDDFIIKRAYEELDRFSWTEAELFDYDSAEMKQMADRGVQAAAFEKGHSEGLEAGREEGLEAGREEGREEGLREGERKKSVEIAKKLLAECLAISQISKITGLSEEELDSLLNS